MTISREKCYKNDPTATLTLIQNVAYEYEVAHWRGELGDFLVFSRALDTATELDASENPALVMYRNLGVILLCRPNACEVLGILNCGIYLGSSIHGAGPMRPI